MLFAIFFFLFAYCFWRNDTTIKTSTELYVFTREHASECEASEPASARTIGKLLGKYANASATYFSVISDAICSHK